MASPSNMSPWPGVTEPLSFPAPDPLMLQPENITDSELILRRLREQIASGTQEPDVLLGAIAVAAQAMTDATGAALGMRRDGTVACVGRSGETSPALGVRLSENSGISGECLRNGRSQRCDDTETDSRVDAEVCRHLGLRSVAAVPIRSRLDTVGILEVFSTSAYAFTEEHLNHLSSLAELAHIASSTPTANPQTIESISPAFEPIERPDLPVLSSQWTRTEDSRKYIWRYLAGAGATVVVGLLLVASWRMWTELKSRNATPSSPVQSAVMTPSKAETLPPATSNLPSKPTPEQIGSTQSTKKGPQKSGALVSAANIESEPDDGLIRNIPTDSPTVVKTNNSTNANKPAEADLSAGAPPQVSMVTASDDSLRSILSPSASLPQLERQRSVGVTPLVLERKVMPTYPHQALIIRREGPVVMHAFVNDKGEVSQLKVLSGDPILGRAAMDAVRQWRYHPAVLNGKPTASETDITLNFRLP
jgi:TonB family protein